ncbi:hypothetical protein BZ164_12425 [Pseudomonas veronii]|nr:hypothetical protein BZ164_12425 [Pseudomonas veronii]
MAVTVTRFDCCISIHAKKTAQHDEHLGKIREVIKANKTSNQANLIRLLNPILRGWAHYYCHVVAKATFNRVDSIVWSMLWQWALRRHPNKGKRWVKKKYFKS